MRVLCFILFVIFFNSLFSQEGELSFTKIKPSGDGYVVYFHVNSIVSSNQADELLSKLIDKEGIFDGEYFVDVLNYDTFKLYIDETVSASYIRQVLLANSVDYNYTLVAIDGVVPNKSSDMFYDYHPSNRQTPNIDGFPEFVDTGSQIDDELRYREAKREWIKNNPEEYENRINR